MSIHSEKPTADSESVLTTRINAEVARILESATPSQSVIYTGNRHDAIPTLLITDPILEPVDKLVWMVTSTRIGEEGGCGVLPLYKELARLANIRSSSTIARALAILRATRWLTLCRQVRDGRGRFRGNVYAMHDEPAMVAEVLTLDVDYLQFLNRASTHAHRRVQIVARSVQISIDEDVADGRYAKPLPSATERRLNSAQAITDTSGGRYFSLTAKSRERLNSAQRNEGDADRVRISKSDGSGSHYKETTTTTSNGLSADAQMLVFPSRLNSAHRELARRHLQTVPTEQRQAVLDELEGRLQAERYGAGPVWDAVRYLARLCERAKAGEFQSNLGIAIAAERGRVKKQVASARQQPASDEPAKSRRARENMQKLRDIVARSLTEKN